MFRSPTLSNQHQYTLLLGGMAAFLVVSIILFPDKAFAASLQGLHIWWKVVFPALLPFLILAEILIAYGGLHFLGVWLEPLMRLLFRLPGVCGPVLAIGYTVGYPSGAKLTAQLRQNETISRNEGDLLLALSHTASPVLIMNVIAVGFFQNAQLGILIILIQLCSTLCLGIFLRMFIYKESILRPIQPTQALGRFKRSINAMQQAHQEDGRAFGKLLGDAVGSSIQLLMLIGGFMMIFSVVIEVISLSRITHLFYALTSSGIPESTLHSLFNGLSEVHLGTYAVSKSESVSFTWTMSMLSCILAWSGFALHTQVKSIIQRTDLRYSSFLIARLIHACLALWLTFWLWSPLNKLLLKVQPSFQQFIDPKQFSPSSDYVHLWSLWGGSFILLISIILVMIILSMVLLTLQRLSSYLNP